MKAFLIINIFISFTVSEFIKTGKDCPGLNDVRLYLNQNRNIHLKESNIDCEWTLKMESSGNKFKRTTTYEKVYKVTLSNSHNQDTCTAVFSTKKP